MMCAQHRWIRGDWQKRNGCCRVPPDPGPRFQKIRSQLVQMENLDNLRRSIALHITLLFLICWQPCRHLVSDHAVIYNPDSP
jgi:hypothetical protein